MFKPLFTKLHSFFYFAYENKNIKIEPAPKISEAVPYNPKYQDWGRNIIIKGTNFNKTI